MKHDAIKMRLVRESMGMTQEKLAILSNVSERTVQRAEAGANMRLDTLADFAAALEIPLSELALDPEDNSERDVSLRLVRSARDFIDDLSKAGVAHFDCEVDPRASEIDALLALVGLIEERLPTPWELDQRPAAGSLSDKIRLTAQIRDLLEQLSAANIGLYAATSWINAQYPRWDMDEGFRYTHDRQAFEKVMTFQMILARGGDDRIYRKPVASWGLNIATPPAPLAPPEGASGDDLDDDVPF